MSQFFSLNHHDAPTSSFFGIQHQPEAEQQKEEEEEKIAFLPLLEARILGWIDSGVRSTKKKLRACKPLMRRESTQASAANQPGISLLHLLYLHREKERERVEKSRAQRLSLVCVRNLDLEFSSSPLRLRLEKSQSR